MSTSGPVEEPDLDSTPAQTIKKPSLILDRITALSAADRVANFAALNPWTVTYCGAKMIVSYAACFLFGSYVYALVGFHWLAILLTRLAVDKCKDQERALVLFGRGWLFCTLVGCSAFVAGNWYTSYITDVPDGGVYLLAYMMALVPVYLQVMTP